MVKHRFCPAQCTEASRQDRHQWSHVTEASGFQRQLCPTRSREWVQLSAGGLAELKVKALLFWSTEDNHTVWGMLLSTGTVKRTVLQSDYPCFSLSAQTANSVNYRFW